MSSLKEYHSLSEQEIAENNYLGMYGYRAGEFCKELPTHTFILPVMLFLTVSGAFVLTAWLLRRRSQRRIVDLTEYLERVNIGAGGTLIQTQEDDFSQVTGRDIQNRYNALSNQRSGRFCKEKLCRKPCQYRTPAKNTDYRSIPIFTAYEEETANEYANQIEKQLDRLNRLEESLLMLSKIDAGTLLLKHERVDLYTALNLAAENLMIYYKMAIFLSRYQKTAVLNFSVIWNGQWKPSSI